MTEKSDIEDFFREIDLDLCQYAYAFHESGFTSRIRVFYAGEHFGFSEWKCLCEHCVRIEHFVWVLVLIDVTVLCS